MKKFLSILCTVIIWISIIPAWTASASDNGTMGDNLTWTVDSEGTLTINGEGSMGYNDSVPWENCRDNVKKVVINNGVTDIADYAFQWCTSLKEVIIADSVTSIRSYAFSNCSSLTNIIVPSKVSKLELGIFNGCTNLTSITIPSSVTHISWDVFGDCINLRDVYYEGDKTSWDKITEYGYYSWNSYVIDISKYIRNANIHYNSSNNVPIINLNTMYLEDLIPSETDKYTGNEGDSFIDKIGKRNGNVDVNGNVWEHGLTAWIARWNYTNESSWAWNTYDLNGQYNSLLGNIVLIKSYNENNFKTQIDIIGDNNILYSNILTPDILPILNLNINISGVNKLKIYLHDLNSVSGGTAFGLSDFRASSDNSNEQYPSDWAKSDIEKAIELGLIPEELQTDWQTPIMRLDFCKLAFNVYKKLSDSVIYTTSSGNFSDTGDLSDEDKGIIGTIKQLGIISGYDDGTFKPYNEITRQEAAAMLMRTAKALGNSEPLEKIGTQFSDCSDCADWAMDGIKYVYNAGIMTGTDETYQSAGVTNGYYIVQFSPYDTYTREQAMVTFYRLYSNFVPVSDSDFTPQGGLSSALKNYEKAVEKYENAVFESVEHEKQQENLKKQMVASMKEHWILADFSGKNEVPDEVYEALYLFTGDLGDFKVITKDADWSKTKGMIAGSIDMTATTLSNIGHGKQEYLLNGTKITIDATVTVGKSGFGTVSWNGNSAMFSSNPKETLSTFQSLVTQSLDLVNDIYTDEFKDVAKELTGYSDINDFLQVKLSKHLNNFMKEMGLGDFNAIAGDISSMLNLAYDVSMSENAYDLLSQMKSLSKKDLLSDTSITNIMVEEALNNLKKAETKLISEAEKYVYNQ